MLSMTPLGMPEKKAGMSEFQEEVQTHGSSSAAPRDMKRTILGSMLREQPSSVNHLKHDQRVAARTQIECVDWFGRG